MPKPWFTTVYLIEQPEPSDTSNGTVISRIGKEHMEIWIDLDKRYMFKIGPNNFFQNNIQGFEVLMRYVTEMMLKYKMSALCFMTYGGVGTIGILLSKYFEKVITVESEPSNVDMIGINAKLNEIKNIKPLLLDARTPWTISDTESL
jgi:tRNA/tmRNA/rRNA uracil-C5-methylase (TrmA/RlmC/RlmD family)